MCAKDTIYKKRKDHDLKEEHQVLWVNQAVDLRRSSCGTGFQFVTVCVINLQRYPVT